MLRRKFPSLSLSSLTLGFAIFVSSTVLHAYKCASFPSFTYIKSVRTHSNAEIAVDFSLPYALRFADCDSYDDKYIAQGTKLAKLAITYKGDENDPRNIKITKDYLEFLSASGSVEKGKRWSLFLEMSTDVSNDDIWHYWYLKFSTDGKDDFIFHEAIIPASRPGGYKVVLQEKIPVQLERYTTFDNGPEYEAQAFQNSEENFSDERLMWNSSN